MSTGVQVHVTLWRVDHETPACSSQQGKGVSERTVSALRGWDAFTKQSRAALIFVYVVSICL